jgi:hypothetical protein
MMMSVKRKEDEDPAHNHQHANSKISLPRYWFHQKRSRNHGEVQ